MLNNFVEKQETFFELYKEKFLKVPKMAFFQRGLTHAFSQKMPDFCLFGFGQNKSRKNA